MTTIAIVDYGMGNLRSVQQAAVHAAPEANVQIAQHANTIRAADRIILPGQGAMPDCMRSLRDSGLLEALLEASRNKPILGVCVGEQMLFERSAEAAAGQDHTDCLGLFPGEVVRFDLAGQIQPDGSRYKVPQMGWNRVKQTWSEGKAHALWEGIAEDSWFYFVHSYYVVPKNPAHIAGQTQYGVTFTCAVARDNIFATQFHPEKSAHDGLRIYRNFAHWNP